MNKANDAQLWIITNTTERKLLAVILVDICDGGIEVNHMLTLWISKHTIDKASLSRAGVFSLITSIYDFSRFTSKMIFATKATYFHQKNPSAMFYQM